MRDGNMPRFILSLVSSLPYPLSICAIVYSLIATSMYHRDMTSELHPSLAANPHAHSFRSCRDVNDAGRQNPVPTMGSKFVHVEVYVIFHIVPFPCSDLSAILSAASEERHMSQERRRKGAHQDSHHPNDRCVKSCMLPQSQLQQITYSSKT